MSKKVNEENKEMKLIKLLFDIPITLTIEEISKKSMILLEEHLNFQAIALTIFNNQSKLRLKASFGLDKIKSKLKTVDFYKRFFFDKETKILLELEEVVFEGLPWLNKYESTIIQPLVYKKNIIGFLILSNKTKRETLPIELDVIVVISHILSNKIGAILNIQVLKNRINDLKDITRRMRHDFANDIQSLALSLELLSSTELSDEQKKYFRILNNAKNSATEKIKELKEIKHIYEKEIIFDIGISL